MKVPLLNFEEGPEVPLLNFEGGGPRVPLLNFRGSQVTLLNLEGGSRGPGPNFTLCRGGCLLWLYDCVSKDSKKC